MVFPLFGVRFISVGDDFDSDDHKGDTGGLEVSFKYLMHEHYSRDLSRKIKSAKHEKMKRGEYTMKNCAFGYIKGADGRLAIDEAAAETVRLIYDMAFYGRSLVDITKRLYADQRPTPSEYKKAARPEKPDDGGSDPRCIWSKSAVLMILSDEQYIGTYIAGKVGVTEVGGHGRRKDESEWFKIPATIPRSSKSLYMTRFRESWTRKARPNAEGNLVLGSDTPPIIAARR